MYSSFSGNLFRISWPPVKHALCSVSPAHPAKQQAPVLQTALVIGCPCTSLWLPVSFLVVVDQPQLTEFRCALFIGHTTADLSVSRCVSLCLAVSRCVSL